VPVKAKYDPTLLAGEYKLEIFRSSFDPFGPLKFLL
jgi:hypothetical protein